MTNLSPDNPPHHIMIIAKRTLLTIKRFVHGEAISGVILVFTTFAALVLANSHSGQTYEQFWNAPLSITLAGAPLSINLHFVVNDILMTIFFLVAGMEIRQEIYDGALSQLKLALLPMLAAIGGVCVPAIIYFSFNYLPQTSHGWAVPTATDIAFAVGILALLGKSVPYNLKIILLALAIIDDIIAIVVIALFYSVGFNIYGLPVAIVAFVLVFLLQRIKVASAWFYIVPAAILWSGLMFCGVHPSLAGVILGLLTPVILPTAPTTFSTASFRNILPDIKTKKTKSKSAPDKRDTGQYKNLKAAQLPPVLRVQQALVPWVQFIIMPLFALANAGINFSSVDFTDKHSLSIIIGIGGGLVLGKPIGILAACFLAFKSGLCCLPPHVDWKGLLLIGFLGGIGFTMAIFTATLSFNDANQLDAAKLAVLSGSFVSALLGLAYGIWYCLSSKRPPH
ncbi:Na+/H+ antiporter NhaA [uncultured Bartonella sp.]|uniref:Na+/H+ antiporter NhaA n=1 Tax=uncultured Bartonella sp. TaxID=104108 RepID=UPI00262B2D2C|nr:Na+/H+ antiporter NhaA [uncultured Bartonella sp.]